MKKDKNEELQSRREFFKSAAKAALPVVGAVVLANLPIATKAQVSCKGCWGACQSNCTGSCDNSCSGCGSSCSSSCSTTCKGSCESTCKGGCESNVR